MCGFGGVWDRLVGVPVLVGGELRTALSALEDGPLDHVGDLQGLRLVQVVDSEGREVRNFCEVLTWP